MHAPMRANDPRLETETPQADCTDPHCARALVRVTDASLLLQLQRVAQIPALQGCTRSGPCCFRVALVCTGGTQVSDKVVSQRC